MTTERKLKPADAARIRCQTMECEARASVCHTVEWNTGNTKGVSFFYYCDEHRENPRREAQAK